MLAGTRADGRSLSDAVVAAGVLDQAEVGGAGPRRAHHDRGARSTPSLHPAAALPRRHARAVDVSPSSAAAAGGPAPELVDGAYAYEIGTAVALHEGLNLADMAHLLQLGAQGLVPGWRCGSRWPASSWTPMPRAGATSATTQPSASRTARAERIFERAIDERAG